MIDTLATDINSQLEREEQAELRTVRSAAERELTAERTRLIEEYWAAHWDEVDAVLFLLPKRDQRRSELIKIYVRASERYADMMMVDFLPEVLR